MSKSKLFQWFGRVTRAANTFIFAMTNKNITFLRSFDPQSGVIQNSGFYEWA